MAKKTTAQGDLPENGRPQEKGKRLRITLVVSPIGFNKTQGKTVQGMGLRRINHSVELLDTPETRGMIHKVRHLVAVTE
jgi:large subunit ribosomal protein L30